MTSSSDAESRVDEFLKDLTDEQVIKLSSILAEYEDSIEKKASDAGLTEDQYRASSMTEGYVRIGFSDEISQIEKAAGKTILDVISGK